MCLAHNSFYEYNLLDFQGSIEHEGYVYTFSDSGLKRSDPEGREIYFGRFSHQWNPDPHKYKDIYAVGTVIRFGWDELDIDEELAGDACGLTGYHAKVVAHCDETNEINFVETGLDTHCQLIIDMKADCCRSLRPAPTTAAAPTASGSECQRKTFNNLIREAYGRFENLVDESSLSPRKQERTVALIQPLNNRLLRYF